MLVLKLLLLIYLSQIAFCGIIKRNCSDFKADSGILCHDADGFVTLVDGRSFNDPNKIEFNWNNETLSIKCYHQILRKKFSNVSSLTLYSKFDKNIYIFENLTNIRYLHFQQLYSSTSWSSLSPPSCSFAYLPNLEKLSILNLDTSIIVDYKTSVTNTFHLKDIRSLRELTFYKISFGDINVDTTSLEYIDLSYNKYSELPKIIFQNSQNLTTLIMKDNLLQSFEVLFSCNYKKLEKLNLSSNKVKSIPTISCTNLKYLDLSYNQIEFILPKTFENVNLKVLIINNNKISKYPDTIFNSMIFLEELQFSVNVEDFRNAIFSQCNNLKILKVNIMVYSQKDQHLDLFSKSFQRNCKNIEDLYLSLSCGSQIKLRRFYILHDLKLEKLSKLSISSPPMNFELILNESFIINHKQLKSIDFERKVSISSLRHFQDLSKVELTSIQTIKSGYFKSLRNIESIVINFGDIRKLPEKLFFETCNLKNLYLYSNELEQLPEKLFKSLDKLLVLSLGNNKLRSLHENLFKPLISIENIDLSRNQLNTLNFKSFFEGLYKDGRSLIYNDQEYILSHGGGKRILDLTDNDVISSFHPKELNEDLKSFNITNRWQLKFGLENIDCYCQMYDINLFALSATAFQNLKFLEIDFIKCKNPTKKYLQYYIDSDFKSLIDPSECPGKCTESENRADCSNRGLTEIPRTLNTYVKELDLRNNNLTSLDSMFIDSITKMNVPTYLSGNDWKCDCDNLTFIDLIRNTSQIRDEVKCLANGKYVISTKFDDDQIQEICTESSSGNIIIGLVLGIIFLTTILVTVSFKKELRIWLFAHRICLCWISEEEVDKNRKYDAFICFSEKDQYFVKQIVQELESGPNPYKLCLHFRDWLVGEYISKQIVTSVEDSRRSIFIIVRDQLN